MQCERGARELALKIISNYSNVYTQVKKQMTRGVLEIDQSPTAASSIALARIVPTRASINAPNKYYHVRYNESSHAFHLTVGRQSQASRSLNNN